MNSIKKITSVIVVGVLVFTVVPIRANDSNSIVPWSLGSVSSTMNSWSSSLLSGISTISTRASVYTLGGVSLLASGYLGCRWLQRENDPSYQLMDKLRKSGLKRCSEESKYKGFEGNSKEQLDEFALYQNNKQYQENRKEEQELQRKELLLAYANMRDYYAQDALRAAHESSERRERLLRREESEWLGRRRSSSNTSVVSLIDSTSSDTASTQSIVDCESCPSDDGGSLGLVNSSLLPDSSSRAVGVGRVTPRDITPDGPGLILSTKTQAICFDQVKRFFNKQGITNLEDVMDSNWRNELVSSVYNRIGGDVDLSRVDSTYFDQVIRSVITEDCSWYTTFLSRRNGLYLDKFRKSKRSASVESTDFLLSKMHATFSSFVEGGDNLPAIVRISVPEQKSAECGPWALANLCTMNRYIQDSQFDNVLPFSFHSESLLGGYFADASRDQMADNAYLAQKAREMNFADSIVVAIDESVGQLPADYTLLDDECTFLNLYDCIKRNIRDKKSTNILLYSKIKCNGCKHSQHWSAVSVAYTGDMKEPVIVLMDSLKGDAELQTRSIVEKALCQISENVGRAMRELNSA